MFDRHQIKRPQLYALVIVLLAGTLGLGWLLLSQGDKPSAVISYLHRLPYLRGDERVYQVSSHDPSGLNKDKGRYLYRENGAYFILDAYGSGAVERIWMNGAPLTATGRLQVYTDDGASPTLDMDLAAFFAGKTAPFLAPLVGDASLSSGGFFSYARLPFAHHIRIATTRLPQYYNIGYRLTANPDPTGSQPDNTPLLPLLQQASNAANVPFGADKPEGGAARQQGHASLGAGETRIVTLTGAGAVTALKLRLSSAAAVVVGQLGLVIQRSGVVSPDVEIPMGAFFGSGIGEHQVNGLPAGVDISRHLFYSYWPLPYSAGLTISLLNPTSQTLTLDYEVEYNTNAYPPADYGRLAYFHASYHSESPRPMINYPLLDVRGAGLYVGATMVISGPDFLQEGDEGIYIDGSSTPQILGTGTEDYFNGGWGFQNGNFSLPTHGNPAGKFGGPQVTAYRWQVNDPIPFGSSLKFELAHGFLGRDYPGNNYTYSSVASYYLRDTPTLSQTDELTFGPQGSAAAHHDQVSGLAWQGQALGNYATTTGNYETITGADDPAAHTTSESGRAINAGGSISFTITLDPANQGVLLRRRLNYTLGFLRGRVSVGGQAAGVWYSPGDSMYNAWRDEEFLLPANLTSTKRSVTVRIDAEADPHAWQGAAAWNEFHYWVYSIMP